MLEQSDIETLEQELVSLWSKASEVVALVENELSAQHVSAKTIWKISPDTHLFDNQLNSDSIQYQLPFEIHILVEDVAHCYDVLGVIHRRWPSVPGRFKDCVSTPMFDGYMSVDTTIVGPAQQRVSVCIRTHEMEVKNSVLVLDHVGADPYSVMIDKASNAGNALICVFEITSRMGHNNPPDNEGMDLTDDIAFLQLQRDLAVLKAQPEVPTDNRQSLLDRISRLKTAGEKIGKYCAEKSDIFVSEAARSGGSEAGKWSARILILSIFGTLIVQVANAAKAWLSSLGIG